MSDLGVGEENPELTQLVDDGAVRLVNMETGPVLHVVGEFSVVVYRRIRLEAVLDTDDIVLRTVTGCSVDQSGALLEGHIRGDDEESLAFGQRMHIVGALEDTALEDLDCLGLGPPCGLADGFQQFGGDDP